MSDTVILHSFGDFDRSGKVRWLAAELGLSVDERRVEFGTHRRPPYTELNPLAHIPAVEFRGETLIESTAACQVLAEAAQSPKLWIGPGEEGRSRYLFWLGVFGESLEGRLVECAVSRAGFLGPEFFDLHEKRLRDKLARVVRMLPESGYLCGDAFTVADVLSGYSLRLAVECGLVAREDVEPYLGRLVERDAARSSRIFASLPPK